LEDGANAVLEERRLSHLMRLDISLVWVAEKRPVRRCLGQNCRMVLMLALRIGGCLTWWGWKSLLSEWQWRERSITIGTDLEDGANAGLEDRRLSHLIRLDISLVWVAEKRPVRRCLGQNWRMVLMLASKPRLKQK
jgi:hypothetical protein